MEKKEERSKGEEKSRAFRKSSVWRKKGERSKGEEKSVRSPGAGRLVWRARVL